MKKKVAPPRGERGLKLHNIIFYNCITHCRSPSWGAWIETVNKSPVLPIAQVAPPRGERGLKLRKVLLMV